MTYPCPTNSDAQHTYYTYDSSNQLVSTTNPDGDMTTNYYDATGNKVAVTGALGNPYGPSNPNGCSPLTTSNCADTAYYTYNSAGEVIQVSYTDGTPTWSYGYSATGQLCWMYQGSSTAACGSAPTGATTYGYNSLGQLVSTTNAAGATITYGYDANSNLNCVSYPNSAGNTCSSSGEPTGVVRYTYNQSNQLQSLTDWAGNTFTFTYNANGQECWVSTYAPSSPTCSSPPEQAGAVTTAYTYDAAGNTSDIETTTGTAPTNLLNLSVGSRNNDEQILSETATVGSTVEPTDSYSYNASDQVSTGPIAGTTGSDSYAYTAQGGIDADTTGFASAAYDQAGVLCWTSTTTSSNSCLNPPSGATTYSTNSDGERTSMTPPSGNPTSYGWDTESGLLTCANTDGSTCSTSNPTSMTTVYTYDGNGLRTSATIGSTTTNFTWGIVAGTSQLFSDGTWDYVYANGSAIPLEQIAASGSSPAADLLLSDESGNVRGLVQLSVGTHQDQLVNYTDYDAYGNPIEASTGTSEAGGVGIPQTGINANYVGSTPWGFGEGYTDPTRLIYLVNRYYDPTTGQFLSVDPEVNVTAEPYEFANDDPVAAVDPSGATFTGGPGSGSQINLPAVAQWATANAPIQAKWDDNGIEPDCTDFASRALSEGGGDPMTYSDDWAWDKLHESNDSLWFEVWNGVGLRAISDSWSEAPHLANHLLGNGSLFVVGEPGGDGLSLGKSNGKPWTGTLPSDVTPGDVIFANLDGVGFDRIDHTGIIVWVNGQCEIAQHTPNYIATFSDWKNHRWMENTSKWETSIWIVMPSPG